MNKKDKKLIQDAIDHLAKALLRMANADTYDQVVFADVSLARNFLRNVSGSEDSEEN